MANGALASGPVSAKSVCGGAEERLFFLGVKIEMRPPRTARDYDDPTYTGIRRNRTSHSAAVIESARVSGTIESRHRPCLARVSARLELPIGSGGAGRLTNGKGRRAVQPPPAECNPGDGVFPVGNRNCFGQ